MFYFSALYFLVFLARSMLASISLQPWGPEVYFLKKAEILIQFPDTSSCYFKQNTIYCEKYDEIARTGTLETKSARNYSFIEFFCIFKLCIVSVTFWVLLLKLLCQLMDKIQLHTTLK